MTANILGRQSTREGAEIRIALSDVAFSTISHLGLMTEAQLSGVERAATGNYIFGAFGRDFHTADLRRVMIAAISAKQWTSLVQACKIEVAVAILQNRFQANFDREEERYEHREPIAALVEKWCAIRNLEEIAATFDRMGVCWGVYQTVRELVSGDVRASAQNPIFENIDTPGIGRHLAAGPAFRVTGKNGPDLKAAQLLGEDSEAVLGEILGLGHAEFVDLTEREIVAGPDRDPYFGQ
jgi:2-methylfumaryl-CoA isomerase